MALEIDLGLVLLFLGLGSWSAARIFLMMRSRRKMRSLYDENLREQNTFLKIFNSENFDDFSAFDFLRGPLSFVSPFPRLIEGEWRYIIYLRRSEVDDVVTITHELSECTVGRVIEKLLNLEKPLYLLRKEDDKFWVNGKKQKYLVEHVMATLGEINDLTHEKLKQRLSREEIDAWIASNL